MPSNKHPLNLSQTSVSHRLHSIRAQSVISVHSDLADPRQSQNDTDAAAASAADPESTESLHSPTPLERNKITLQGQTTTATHSHQAVERTRDTCPVPDDCTKTATTKPEALLSGGMLKTCQSSSGTWSQTRNENSGKEAPWCMRCELWGPVGHTHQPVECVRDPSAEPVDCTEASTMKPEAFLSKSMLNVYHPFSGLWTQRRNDNPGKDAPWCVRCKVCETPHVEMSDA
jgi:hypothetical protein